MIFEETNTSSTNTSSLTPEEEDDESLEDGDECDHHSTDSCRPPELSPKSAKELIHKQLGLTSDGQHWSSTSYRCPSTSLSDDCSLSSHSVCCSPISRNSSPCPESVCGTPTLCQYSPPSTLTTIRDAVSHLTRLDDFNVVKLSQGFFSQVFKVLHHLEDTLQDLS